MVTIALGIIWFVVFASLVANGLWTNMLMTINVMLAILVAGNYYEPLAAFFDKQWPKYTYLWDFVSLWMIFGLTFMILRAATDQLSKVRVRFRKPVEIGGGILFALGTAASMMSFTNFTMHTAPLARNFMRESFQPDPRVPGPDARVRAMYGITSAGSLSRWKPNVFDADPQNPFVYRYGWRRAEFEKQLTTAKK